MSEAIENTEVAEGAEPRRHRKTRTGVVVSAKTAQTVIVRVERRVKHPRYNKYVTRRKRYAAHDLMGCAEGDIVVITETAPVSKTKHWRVSKKIEKDG